jgi:hypothetical protein
MDITGLCARPAGHISAEIWSYLDLTIVKFGGHPIRQKRGPTGNAFAIAS